MKIQKMIPWSYRERQLLLKGIICLVGKETVKDAVEKSQSCMYEYPRPGTRIYCGCPATAISGIWPSGYQDQVNRDKWNPKNIFKKCYFGISSQISLLISSTQLTAGKMVLK